MKTRRVEPDVDIVELIGTLNLGSTLSWIEADIRRLIKQGGRKLIIDVSQLRYADSAGIGMLVTINGEVEQAGGKLHVVGANGMVAKSFSITHIDRVIPMDADIEAACRRLGGADGLASGQ